MFSNKTNYKIKLKEKNHNSRNKSNSLPATNNMQIIYETIKRQKLNELKDRTRRVSQIMETIGETYNVKNHNLKMIKADLLNQNLTKINYRRSLLITKKLKDINKLNAEFDEEYLNQKNAFNEYKGNNYDSSSEDINNNSNSHQNNLDSEFDFTSEQRRIFKILFRKNDQSDNRPFSDYKKNKKLKDLKSNIEYVCGIKLDEENSKNKTETLNSILNKNSHYFIPKRNPRFIREKNINDNFTPSRKYDKTKIFFERNYDKSKSKEDKTKQYINYTLQNYLSNNFYHKKKIFNGKKDISITPIKKRKIKKRNDNELNEIEKLPIINKEETKENNNKTIDIENSSTKLKLKNISYNNKRNSSKIYIKNLKTENNDSEQKNISIKLKNLLKDSLTLNSDLKFGLNIISSHFDIYKKKTKKDTEDSELDIEKIRKDLHLNKINPIIRESDIIVKNEKKMEKKIRKEDAHILRKIVNIVLQEDRLANRNAVYNSNSLNSKLKKIMERRIKTINTNEFDEYNEPENDKIEMLKLFKKDNPDFFNIKHLSNLIKRYKTMKVK